MKHRAEHGELQGRVLEVVRQCQSCTVRDVHEALCSEREVAYTTVLTVMSRLVQRGILERHKQGKAGVFSLAVSDDADAAGRAVEYLLGRFGNVAIAQFVSHAKASPDVLEELRRLVESDEPA